MKKILLLMTILPMTLFTACSSDDESGNEETGKFLTNTSWTYHTEDKEHALKDYNDYENEHQLKNVLQICPSIKYTAGERQVVENETTVDLCKENGHGDHMDASLKFNADNCIYEEKTYHHIQSVKSYIEKNNYKFEEGTYIGTLYGNCHVGITVKSYGIYQASTSGDILILPLDGNYTYTLEIRKYASTENKETVTDNSYATSYKVNGNEITFLYGQNVWNGILDATKTNIKFSCKKPVEKDLYIFSIHQLP